MGRLRVILRTVPPRDLAADAIGAAILTGWVWITPDLIAIASAVMEVGP